MLKWHTDLLYKEELHPTLAAASAFRLGCVGQSSAHSWADTLPGNLLHVEMF